MDFFRFRKRNLAVDVKFPAGVSAVNHVLTALDTDSIQSVLGYIVYFPLKPLTGNLPLTSSNGIQLYVRGTVGNRFKRGTVVNRIDGSIRL